MTFPQIWTAALVAGALATTWYIVDGRSLFVYPLKMRYYDLLMWTRERQMWIRETKRWASTLTGELVDLRQALGLVAQATSGVIRHSLSTRPRYNSPEWQAYRNHLGQRADFANNRWRDGKPPVQPATYFPPWRLSYSGFTRENPAGAHKPPEPVVLYDEWKRNQPGLDSVHGPGFDRGSTRS